MFAKKLKELRAEKNLTQKQLAEKLILSKNSICEYEKGRSEPNIETLIKLADILDCSIDYLVGRFDDFGIIDLKPDIGKDETFLVSSFKRMSERSRDFLLSTLHFLEKLDD